MSIPDKNQVVGLFGPTGMAGTAIGYQLRARGFTVKEFSREIFDIGRDAVASLDFSGLSGVVNAAGIINRLERSENFARNADAVNRVFPMALAAHCNKLQLPLIHISTDCVFDGSKGLSVESDVATASDVYGISKHKGEPSNAMVLRLSMVGPEAKNYYSLLCWFLAQQGECNGYIDHQWNGITTIQLGSIIADLFDKDLYREGLFHIYSDDVTKHELLELFKTNFDKEITIHPVASEAAKDMRLRTEHGEFLSSLAIPSIREQVAIMTRFSDGMGRWCPDVTT